MSEGEVPQSRPREDLTGRRFGKLVVLHYLERRKKKTGKYGVAYWRCRCDCGTETDMRGYHMKAGKANSCGCGIVLSQHRYTHRAYGTPEYRAYQGMLTRCFNRNEPTWPRYGGRGITVDREWLGQDGFSWFFLDVGCKPSPLHSLDRIDNDKNYGPGNCRWATREEQANNKACTIRVFYQGEQVGLRIACRDLDVCYETIRNRMLRGLAFDEAVRKPIRGRDGPTIADLCRESGLPYTSVMARIRRGWSQERALSEPIKGRSS